ncbi:beta strand repeat-containing protein, partial [Saccharibacter floricola]
MKLMHAKRCPSRGVFLMHSALCGASFLLLNQTAYAQTAPQPVEAQTLSPRQSVSGADVVNNSSNPVTLNNVSLGQNFINNESSNASLTNISNVNGNASNANGQLTLDNSTVQGNLINGTGTANVQNNSSIFGNLTNSGGSVNVSGSSQVSGDLNSNNGKINISSGANVQYLHSENDNVYIDGRDASQSYRTIVGQEVYATGANEHITVDGSKAMIVHSLYNMDGSTATFDNGARNVGRAPTNNAAAIKNPDGTYFGTGIVNSNAHLIIQNNANAFYVQNTKGGDVNIGKTNEGFYTVGTLDSDSGSVNIKEGSVGTFHNSGTGNVNVSSSVENQYAIYNLTNKDNATSHIANNSSVDTISNSDNGQVFLSGASAVNDAVTNSGHGLISMDGHSTAYSNITNSDSATFSLDGQSQALGPVSFTGGTLNVRGGSSVQNLTMSSGTTVNLDGGSITGPLGFTVDDNTTTLNVGSGGGSISEIALQNDTGNFQSASINGVLHIGTIDQGFALMGSLGNNGSLQVDEANGQAVLLTGQSTSKQATTFSGGTLQLGDGKTQTSLAGDINLPIDSDQATSDGIDRNTLVLQNPDRTTNVFSGHITGNADLVQKSGINILSNDNSYSGNTTIKGGTLQLGDGHGAGSITSPVVQINKNGSLLINRDNTLVLSSELTGRGSLEQAGTGTTVVTHNNDRFSGAVKIDQGSTLQLGDGHTQGSIGSGAIANDGTLSINHSGDFNLTQVVSGNGVLNQDGSGTTVIANEQLYKGDTHVNAGTLQLGDGHNTGSIQGNAVTVAKGATFAINRGDTFVLNQTVSGDGQLVQNGSGTTVLTGNNSYTGGTQVEAGTLDVEGDNSKATGTLNVASGASLTAKQATIGGDVHINSGATFSPGSTTINGSLTLDQNSIQNLHLGQSLTEGGAYNDFVNVKGNLALGGTLNVTPSQNGPSLIQGDLGPGVYRVYDYGGKLSGNIQHVNVPHLPGVDFTVQTAVDHQVNLVAGGKDFNFWDGDNDSHRSASGSGNGKIDGGSGVWRALGNGSTLNWTKADGSANTPWMGNNFAIFNGSAGTVQVSDKSDTGAFMPVTFNGAQFANNDGKMYVIKGDTLYATTPETVIDVGDHSGNGASTKDEIDSVIDGSQVSGGTALHKTDAGTLILGANNNFSRPTVIEGGTLQLGNGGATGDIGRADITDNGTLAINRNNDVTLSQVISGSGGVTQLGTGTTILSGHNHYAGLTDVQAGQLKITGSIDGALAVAGGEATVDHGSVGGAVTNHGTFTSHGGSVGSVTNAG